MIFRKPFLFAFAITLGIFGATAAIAWTGPSASPPSGNASAPLNTSATGQVKAGGLQLNTGGAATGLIVGGATQLDALTVSNRLTVSEAGGAYTYITLRDDESPNGVKYLHANSNVMGFLNGSGSWMSYWDNSGNQHNQGSITAQNTLDAKGPSNNWAGIFRPAGPYGLVVTSNNYGCYSYLAYSSYGLQTNCGVYASDVYVSASGMWMSTLVANNPRNGGQYWYGSYSYIPNPVTGGYSCPSGFSAYGPYTIDLSDGHFSYTYICR
jgi:hypothetical protein